MSPRVASHFAAKRWVLEHAAQYSSKAFSIANGDEKAAVAIDDDVSATRHVSGDGGATACGGFDKDARKALAVGRQTDYS